jgi:hypothetical protein
MIDGNNVSMEKFAKKIMYRLGNMTLLLPKDNSKLGNESFEIKNQKVFSKSDFFQNQDISKETIWSLKEITKYQKKMAEIAKEIW